MRFEISMLLSPLMLGILLGLCILVFFVLSIAFIYHWREYGMDTRIIRTAPAVYLVVSMVLVALAIISYLALF